MEVKMGGELSKIVKDMLDKGLLSFGRDWSYNRKNTISNILEFEHALNAKPIEDMVDKETWQVKGYAWALMGGSRLHLS
jgi:hypothetical protein